MQESQVFWGLFSARENAHSLTPLHSACSLQWGLAASEICPLRRGTQALSQQLTEQKEQPQPGKVLTCL